MATMEDIAKKLCISKGTVSKALSGAPDVSETMRKTILETAVELGYQRGLRRDEAMRLCVFVENMDYRQREDLGHDIILGFRKMAEPDGCAVSVQPLTAALQAQCSFDAYMLEHRCAGALLLGPSLSDPWLAQLKGSRTPAVLYDNYVSANPATAYVGVDNFEAMRLAVAHLQGLGHRRIGYLSGFLGSFINQQRYDAFFQALRAHGLPHEESQGGILISTILLHARLVERQSTAPPGLRP